MLAFFRSSSKSTFGSSQARSRMVPSIPMNIREDVLPVELYGPFEVTRTKR